MKKNNTFKLLGVLGVLVVIYLIVTFTGDDGRSKSFRSVLVDLDTARVSRIEILSNGKTTLVEKVGSDAWKVTADDLQKAAVSSVVKNLFATLEGAKPSRLVARSSDKWRDYAVDSTGTRIQIFEGQDKSLDLVIGRFGVEGQRNFHTFVRLFDEEDVYVANDFMGISLPKEDKDFRNGDVLRLNRDSLTQIAFNYPDSSFSIYRENDRWYSTEFELDSANNENYMRGLSFVTSKDFANDAYLGTPVLNVTYSFSNQPEIQLSAYQSESGYVIQSSENGDELFEDGSVFEKVFKGSSFFVGAN